MKHPWNRVLAVAIAAGAALTIVIAPPTSALPMCGYLIYWYDSPAKTTVVGSRVSLPEGCPAGCNAFETGQRTSYSTYTTLTNCIEDYFPD